MPLTQEQLDSFHRFATQKINTGCTDMTMRELLQLWALDNPSAEEQADVAAIIRQGDKDIEAGNFQTLDDFMDDFRSRNDIPQHA